MLPPPYGGMVRWSSRLHGLRNAFGSKAPAWLSRQPRVRHVLTLLRRSFDEFRKDHCQQLAAAISYHVLFSIFPLAITGVGILGLFMQSDAARNTVVDAVLKVVPLTDAGSKQLHQLLSSIGGGAGAVGILGFVGVLWSASGMMAAIRTALNIAWDTDQHRPFFRGKAVDLLLLGASFVVVAAALAVTIVTSVARRGSGYLPSLLQPLAGTAASIGAFLVGAAMLFGIFLLLFRYVPAVTTRVRDIWPGALLAAIGFELLQLGFSIYVAHFAHYNKVYGSLGAVVAFLFFVYLANLTFLFGAEAASEYPRLPPMAAPAGDNPPTG
jgi:membrane protein